MNASKSPSTVDPTDPPRGPARPPKLPWALRRLTGFPHRMEARADPAPPRVGDLALVRVERLGYHSAIMTRDNRKLRVYPDDTFVGVFGNRYATDAFEAEVSGTEDLSLLTAAGMIGTVRSSHRDVGRPTSVSFLGYLAKPSGGRLNLKELLFVPRRDLARARNLIVVVGTGMNAGKTTVASQLAHGLVRLGYSVAAGKLTGSVSNRDVDEMYAATMRPVIDFSYYGFPSTYQAAPAELRELWRTILAKSMETAPDFLVMEIADGIVQRETSLILLDPTFRAQVSGVILAADGALSALWATQSLTDLGYNVWAVSGALTSSPLYVRELQSQSNVPVLPSLGDGAELASLVVGRSAVVPETGLGHPGTPAFAERIGPLLRPVLSH